MVQQQDPFLQTLSQIATRMPKDRIVKSQYLNGDQYVAINRLAAKGYQSTYAPMIGLMRILTGSYNEACKLNPTFSLCSHQ